MKANPAAILFDKDGTLIDYHRSWSGVNRTAALMAARGDPDLAAALLVAGGFNPALGRTDPDTPLAAGSAADIARVWASAGSPLPRRELQVALDGLFQDVVDMAVPVTDLEALFGRLKARGVKLGIASSDSERAVRRTASRFRIDIHVDFVAGYDSGYGTKPDAGMFDAFCLAVGVRPAQAAMVGDNAHDMAMAAAGGAGFRIAVLTGTGTRGTLESCCDTCIESIAHLEDLLNVEGAAANRLAD